MADQLDSRFREYVSALNEEEVSNATSSLAEGRALVENWIRGYTVPPEILDRSIIEVAAELFYHKMARGGVTEWAGTDLQPFRLARDPMIGAYRILAQFVPAGLA